LNPPPFQFSISFVEAVIDKEFFFQPFFLPRLIPFCASVIKPKVRTTILIIFVVILFSFKILLDESNFMNLINLAEEMVSDFFFYVV
jgi:hypothetical protein